MSDDGDYICLSDDESQAESTKETPTISDSKKRLYIDLDALSYSFDDEVICSEQDFVDQINAPNRPCLAEVRPPSQQLKNASLPSSSSPSNTNPSPPASSHNSSSESWVSIVVPPRKSVTNEAEKMPTDLIEPINNNNNDDDDDVILIYSDKIDFSNNSTQEKKSKSPAKSTIDLNPVETVVNQTPKCAEVTEIETRLVTTNNSQPINMLNLNSTPNFPSSDGSECRPKLIVSRGKDLNKLKALVLETEPNKSTSSDSSMCSSVCGDESVNWLDHDYTLNRRLVSFEKDSPLGKEKNGKYSQCVARFFANDFKLKQDAIVLVKKLSEREVECIKKSCLIRDKSIQNSKTSSFSSLSSSSSNLKSGIDDLILLESNPVLKTKKKSTKQNSEAKSSRNSLASNSSILATSVSSLSTSGSFQALNEAPIIVTIKKHLINQHSSNDVSNNVSYKMSFNETNNSSKSSSNSSKNVPNLNETKSSESTVNSHESLLNQDEFLKTTLKNNSSDHLSLVNLAAKGKKAKKRSRSKRSTSSASYTDSSGSDIAPKKSKKKTKKLKTSPNETKNYNKNKSQQQLLTNKTQPSNINEEKSSKLSIKKTQTAEPIVQNSKLNLSTFKIPKVNSVNSEQVNQVDENNQSTKNVEQKEKKTNEDKRAAAANNNKTVNTTNSSKKTKKKIVPKKTTVAKTTSILLNENLLQNQATNQSSSTQLAKVSRSSQLVVEKLPRLSSLIEIMEKRKEFSLALNCRHPYLSMYFLLNEYVEKMKLTPYMNFAYFQENLPSVKDEISEELSVAQFSREEQLDLCKLMSRSAGLINFYRLFGFGYDLRGPPGLTNHQHKETIKPLDENSTEQNQIDFFSKAIPRLTLSEIYAVYLYYKHKLNSPYRTFTIFYDEELNGFNIRVKFENNKMVGGLDHSIESSITHVLHRKESLYLHVGNYLHKNTMFRSDHSETTSKKETKNEEDKTHKSAIISEASKQVNNKRLWDSIYMQKFYKRIDQRLAANQKFNAKNFSKKNQTLRHYMQKPLALPEIDNSKGIFKNYQSKQLIGAQMRGKMNTAEKFKLFPHDETKARLKQLQKENFNFDLDRLFFDDKT